ncbi:hypothetical protein [Aquimarina sp. RZ0]|uniref:hypothetical protein n=1 Tax=Aquimarina sp. RZ0 TaxID=2607730 RepID=UPI0011F3976A|nr:hypothetical protein [Aquimarina sp. RZ0]KAA1244983.1 hypothetical protein F0000_13995 [Aquimarina sp. RZ0]
MKSFLKKIIFVFSVAPSILAGQTRENDSMFYVWFDQVIGLEHTGLNNGKQFVNLDANKIFEDKHPYFYSNDPLKGSITYDGQTYYDINMKYNQEIDALIVKLNSPSAPSIIQLVSDKVESFVINNFKFIRLESIKTNTHFVSGFHQVLLESDELMVLKRQKKSKSKHIETSESNRLYYEYLGVTKYILFYEGMYKNIKSKSDIIKIFPEAKEKIRKFYKTHKRLLKKEHDLFLIRLFDQIITPSVSKNEF